MNIDWTKITVYEVDPVCKFPGRRSGYQHGCRCLRCWNINASRRDDMAVKERRYIPEEEWTR